MRKSYGFRTNGVLELSLYHSLGKLPGAVSTHDFFSEESNSQETCIWPSEGLERMRLWPRPELRRKRALFQESQTGTLSAPSALRFEPQAELGQPSLVDRDTHRVVRQ
jgi:hypothetical protein